MIPRDYRDRATESSRLLTNDTLLSIRQHVMA